MKKSFLIFIIGFVLSISNLFADEAGYTIKDYQFQGIYYSNNTVEVKETITVNFDEARHGIYRNIPQFFYLNVSGDDENVWMKKYSTKVKHFSANGDKFKKSTEDDNYVFKLGDKNKKIKGEKTYELSYTYVFPDDRYPDADFVYYSVLGPDWATEIDHFEFMLSFENGLPENLIVHSGSANEVGNQLDVRYTVSGNTIHGFVNNVPPNNAVTLFSEVPEGYFSKEYVPVYKIPVWLLYILAVAFSIYGAYKCLTAKTKKPVQTVEFYPPDGISSCEVGTIIDNSVDTIDLASMIPTLAKKGYLTIQEDKVKSKSVVTLIKVKDLPEDFPVYQKTFFDGLFAESEKIELTKEKIPTDFRETLGKSKNELSEIFTGDRKLYNSEMTATIYGIVSCLLSALVLMNDTLVAYFENFWGLMVPAACVCLCLNVNISAYKRFFEKKKFMARMIISTIIFLVVVLIYCYSSMYDVRDYVLPWWALIVLFVVNFLSSFFGYRTVQPTDYNLMITGKLMGLQEFIKTAEVPRLQKLTDENPEYFYDILPYAMVFELTEKWSDLFKEINVNNPSWYASSHVAGDMFNPVAFSHMLDDGISSAIVTSTSSSGSSGGGGGGGGGGSW